jgi:hypothetical protein
MLVIEGDAVIAENQKSSGSPPASQEDSVDTAALGASINSVFQSG